MYAIVGANDGGSGWRGIQFNSSLVATEIGEDCIPPSLRWTGYAGSTYSGGGNIVEERMIEVYDLNSVIGTTDIYLYYAASSTGGTPYVAYRWNGPNTLMTVVDTGGDVAHSLPSSLAFGERIFTAGELDIKITARVGVIGGEEISFIVYGGGTGRRMKLHYTQNGTPDLLPATLRLPVTGGSATLNTGSNQVEGIAADGTTVYTIVWEVATDGLSASNRVNRVPEVLA